LSKSFRRACFFWQGFASFFIWNFLFAPLFVSFLSRFVSFFKATSNNTFQSKQVHTSGLLLLLVMSYKKFEYCSICVWESAVVQELPYSLSNCASADGHVVLLVLDFDLDVHLVLLE